MGGFTGLFDRPDPQTAMLVKNPDLQAYIDQNIRDYGRLRDTGNAALDDFIRQYQAGQGDAERYTGEETGAIGQFYNGDMARRLSDLRTRRQAAINEGADMAARQAQRGLNSNRVASGGTGSSYQQRLAIGALAPIRTQAAIDAANAERGDVDYLTGNQIALAGSRGRMRDALAGRALVPWQTRASMSGTNQGILGGLINQDQANKFYGIKQDPGLLDRMQQEVQFLQGLQSIMKNQYGTASEGAMGWSSMGGGGGGGGGMGGMMGGMGGGGGGGGTGFSFRRGGLVRVPPMEVPGHDYRAGGRVAGPGTANSDSIPAMLSDGEFVMPASAVQIPGVLALLQKIRRQALTQPGVAHMSGGGLLYADSWGGLGQQNLARDQFNEATMAGEVAQIQQQQQFDKQAGLQQQRLNQSQDAQNQESYQRFLQYYGMPRSRGGGGPTGEYYGGAATGGSGTPGPMYGGYDWESAGFARGGLVRHYADGGEVRYESPATRMWRMLAERRSQELSESGNYPMTREELQARQLSQGDRQLDLEERRVKQLEAGGSPQSIRDREFQEKQLESLGNVGGINSIEHAQQLAPDASDTARQLAFENSMAYRKPEEQRYQNARTASQILNKFDQSIADAEGHTTPVTEPTGVRGWMSDTSEAAKAKRKKINEALALIAKVGPNAAKLKQSQLVQLDPDSNSWVPAIPRPRWLPAEETPKTPATGAGEGYDLSRFSAPAGMGGGLSGLPVAPTESPNRPSATPDASTSGRRYSPWVYSRVNELSKMGIQPVQALTRALQEERELFSR